MTSKVGCECQPIKHDTTPHPHSEHGNRHYQRDADRLWSPAVEKCVHGGMLPNETTGQERLCGPRCCRAVAYYLSGTAISGNVRSRRHHPPDVAPSSTQQNLLVLFLPSTWVAS